MHGETRTYYAVTFVDWEGKGHRLDTIDPAKIGPWIAEMFMLFPYRAATPTSLRIDISRVPLPGA